MTEPTVADIVRHRYETSAYGNAHLKVTRQIVDAMRQHPPKPPTFGTPLGDLMGIPVVVDDTLPSGVWRLVDSKTGETLHEGEWQPAPKDT